MTEIPQNTQARFDAALREIAERRQRQGLEVSDDDRFLAALRACENRADRRWLMRQRDWRRLQERRQQFEASSPGNSRGKRTKETEQSAP